MGLMQTNKIQTEVLHPLHIKAIYNFSWRLSGSTKVAEVLTEKVFLKHPDNHKSQPILLKQAWEEFLKYYGCLDLKGEDAVQEALLSLSPELRCAVILRDIMDYSYQQIAVILDKSDFEAAELVSMARQQFAKVYKKTDISV